MDRTLTCLYCGWQGPEEQAESVILSIMYRTQYDDIQAFKQFRCPRCNNLIAIIFEILTCKTEEE